jgi:hypothetical protein
VLQPKSALAVDQLINSFQADLIRSAIEVGLIGIYSL